MIKAVILDFGGVVVNAGFEEWKKEYLVNEPAIHDKALKINPEVDRGTLPASAYTDLFATVSNKSSQEINTEILLNYELHEDVVSLIKKLREKVKVGLIANFPVDWFDYLSEKFHVADFFDSITVSGKIHMIKPEAEIYFHSLQELDTRAEEAVFVDDKKENVLGAKNIGMYGIVFTDTSSLIHDLKQLGLQV